MDSVVHLWKVYKEDHFGFAFVHLKVIGNCRKLGIENTDVSSKGALSDLLVWKYHRVFIWLYVSLRQKAFG